jgi:hypothetical protein
VRAALIRGDVTCVVFRSFVCHFQAGELAEEDRIRLHEHMDRCPPCAKYLAVEEAFVQTLQSRIPRASPPEGLESRVRSALLEHREIAPEASRKFSARTVWSLAAAVAFLALLPFTAMMLARGAKADPDVPVHVVQAAQLVDEDCDRAGHSIEAQRQCRTSSHLNAWKLDDGSYWSLSTEDAMARTLVSDAAQRGRRFVVEGDYYPKIRTIHLTRMPTLASTSAIEALEIAGPVPSLR